jgi:large subunit ribosomal protein L22
MGSRKRQRAEQLKEAKKSKFIAKLNNCPTSPRKMRLIADMIRGEEINRALDLLKFSSKVSSKKIEKLLLSAIANWQNKNENAKIDESNLYVKEIFVNQGRTLKRIRPAPQGRAYRIRKRSNHVTIVLDSLNKSEEKVNQTN